jgi:DNA-binding transcriptional MerR regulator
VEPTYPLRAAARLTGLSPELVRAWERRYGAVQPTRTPGGTRRYSAADLERLRLLKAAVDAGHRIGQIARLDAAELERRVAAVPAAGAGRIEEILGAFQRLEASEAQRLLSLQLAALGPVPFARDLACPLVREIGERWSAGRMGIAAEHLASALLRSLLGSALQPSAASLLGPRVVFATPSGERHELGLLMAALTALGAGANPLYLGADLPVEELLDAAARARAGALALGLVSLSPEQATHAVGALRDSLPDAVHLWIGGVGAAQLRVPPGVEILEGLEQLERRIALLVFQVRAGG